MSSKKQKNIIQELQKRLETHWKNTEKERKRTHTGEMYKKYMEKDKNEGKS